MLVLPAARQVAHGDAEEDELIDRAITERALVTAARASGLDRDEEVRRRVRRAEEQELQQALLSREVGGTVTDEAIRARYEQEAAKRQGEPEVDVPW